MHMQTPDLNDEIGDECLMDAVMRGNTAAMAALYERYNRSFFSLAYQSTARKQIAEDLVQAAFLAIWRNRAAYSKEAGSVRGWLFSIMHYRIIDYLRRQRFLSAWKEIPLDDIANEEAPLLPDPWEEAWREEQAVLVHKAVQMLPCEQRRAIELAYFEGLTHEEVAACC